MAGFLSAYAEQFLQNPVGQNRKVRGLEVIAKGAQ
jgi:hypothetical protein